jgi:predicted TIM-barrel fold metal-dependent hydrolase
MIVDSHLYCFEPPDSPSGHASGQAHLDWIQASHAGHQQPAWRIRDRAPASSLVLAPECYRNLPGVPDVKFRPDRERGRFVWTVDGEDYTKQFFPPNLLNLQYTPHSAIAEMDHAGVDMALLHTDPMLGRNSDFLAACVALYPDRLRSMAPVDEWRIVSEPDAVISELETSIRKLGLHAIKFIPPLAYLTSSEPWDDGSYRPFWEVATQLGVPVFFTLDGGPESLSGKLDAEQSLESYRRELAILMRWMERYPDVTCSLTHGFPWRLFLDGDSLRLPAWVWAPFANPKCNVEVSFPVRLGDLFDYPYREVWPTLETMVERVGADHLLWGTDMPFQNRFCTYRQSREYIEKYCGFLGADNLALIMGGTAARILSVSRGDAEGAENAD